MIIQRTSSVAIILLLAILVHNTAHNAVFMRWNEKKMYNLRTLPDVFMGSDPVSPVHSGLRTLAFAVICASALLLVIQATCFSLDERRSFVLNRAIIVYSVSSVLRCATFFVTLLPATATYCIGKSIGGTYDPTRAPQNYVDVALRFDWTHSCGDLLFSGHTILVMCAFLAVESLADELKSHVHSILLWASRISLLPFLFLTVYTRKHYTIDVGVAVFVTVAIWHAIRPVRDETLTL